MVAEPGRTEEKIFKWMPEHQKAFDALKEALAKVSFQVLGAMLSQHDESDKFCVMAYVSQSLHPLERSMCN